MSATSGKAKLTSLYASLDYGDDFLGVPDALYLNALMDKYHMLLLQTLSQGAGISKRAPFQRRKEEGCDIQLSA